MRQVLSVATAFVWALWFGGLMMVFVLIKALFARFGADPKTFGDVGSTVFRRFEQYQLFLGAAALLLSLIGLAAHRSRPRWALLVLFLLATGAAVFATRHLTPQIDALREAGQSAAPQFKTLHGLSMLVYVSEAALLLLAGVALPLDLRQRR